MRTLRLSRTVLSITLSVFSSHACGQPNWQFTRLDQGTADLYVGAADYPQAYTSYGADFDEAGGNILENVATNASVSSDEAPGSAYAQGTTMAQAMNLTPVGGISFAPTVDVTLTRSNIATSTEPKYAYAGQEGGATAGAGGQFELDGDIGSGFLHGSMYLVGLVAGSASGTGEWIGGGSLVAEVFGYSVRATWSNSQNAWTVMIDLPELTETTLIPSLYHYFTFSIPVTLPETIDLVASAGSNSIARSGPSCQQDGVAEIQEVLSASAWVTFTPTEDPPLPGDFDGDGDVDGDDFLILQRGFGETNGATLSEGDADHNGTVDGNDLAIWETNYGVELTLMSGLSAVPEPSTFALSIISGLVYLTSRRMRMNS